MLLRSAAIALGALAIDGLALATSTGVRIRETIPPN
jgi:hypothetical protein